MRRTSLSQRECRICGETKDLTEFGSRKSGWGGTYVNRMCRPCERAEARRRASERRLRAGPPAAEQRRGVEVTLNTLPPVTDEELHLSARAACKGLPWFELDDETCKEVCDVCPVLPECRRHVDSIEQATAGAHGRDRTVFFVGVWAGETPSERLARRRGRTLAPSAQRAAA